MVDGLFARCVTCFCSLFREMYMQNFSLRFFRSADPRWYQIVTLLSLVVYGAVWLDLEIDPLRSLLIVVVALLTQFVFTRVNHLPSFDPKSAMISSLSLCLLLRTNHIELATLAAFITIAAKFVVRFDGKHVFNPTNFGIVVMMLLTNRVWVSPGQWGNTAVLTLFLLCAGMLVVRRAERSDVTIAFLGFYSAILFLRALYLGDPIAIPLHQMQNGAFIIFAFFMISDPKTTPNSRTGRIVFALMVAFGGALVQFVLFRTNGLLWSLVICSFAVPLLNRIFRGKKYEWNTSAPTATSVSLRTVAAALVGCILFLPPVTTGFCGFYVAKADASLYNQASQVVLARKGDRTVITMASDYKGDPKEFALVVPVPVVIGEKDIRVVEKQYIDRIDAFSAPRLVEYFDADPCNVPIDYDKAMSASSAPGISIRGSRAESRNRQLGVVIEAQYAIGEYDILILSAKQSGGLRTWLVENGYKIPRGAATVLGSYIKQKMKFFVAKVNLGRRSKAGFSYLRPIQVEYTSPKFMLPIRLGTVNAQGPQDLLIYALTQTGRVETTNYRTVRLPSGVEIPVFVKDEFADFYRAMFNEQVRKEKMTTVFLEYAWNMAWCDPCAAAPLSAEELKQLGVFWLADAQGQYGNSGAQNAYISRLHVRYDASHFPEDLVFQETGDMENYQSRFVLRHPWQGEGKCNEVATYRKQLAGRLNTEAQTLASLTGWSVSDIRKKIDIPSVTKNPEWWNK